MREWTEHRVPLENRQFLDETLRCKSVASNELVTLVTAIDCHDDKAGALIWSRQGSKNDASRALLARII